MSSKPKIKVKRVIKGLEHGLDRVIAFPNSRTHAITDGYCLIAWDSDRHEDNTDQEPISEGPLFEQLPKTWRFPDGWGRVRIHMSLDSLAEMVRALTSGLGDEPAGNCELTIASDEDNGMMFIFKCENGRAGMFRGLRKDVTVKPWEPFVTK